MPTIAQLLNPNRRKVKPRWPLHPPYIPKPGTDTLVNIDRGPRPEWMNHSVVDPEWTKRNIEARWYLIVEGKPSTGTIPILQMYRAHKANLDYAVARLHEAEVLLCNGNWDAAMLRKRGRKRGRPVAVHLVQAVNVVEARDAIRAGKVEATVRR